MTAVLTSPWLFWLTAAPLGLIALILFMWALFLDRSHGKRRCPKCWYNLTGTDSLTCSECGHTARRPRQLLKTRRRKHWALFAILLMAGCVTLGLTPKVKRDGIASITPTTILIAGLEWMPSGFGIGPARIIYTSNPSNNPRFVSFRLELERRAEENTLWNWQWDWLINKCIDGDDKRPPPLTDWFLQYCYFLQLAAQHGIINPDSDDPRIISVRYYINTKMRDAWPADTPVRIKVHLGPALSDIRADFPGWIGVQLLSPKGITVYQWSNVGWTDSYSTLTVYREKTQSIGFAPNGATALDIEFTFNSGVDNKGAGDSNFNFPYTKVITFTIRIEGTIDDYVFPVAHKQFEQALANTTDARLLSSIETVVRLPIDHLEEHLVSITDTTLALRFELIRNGEIIGSSEAWWASNKKGITIFSTNVDNELGLICTLNSGKPTVDLNATDHWQLRITGDPEIALRNFNCDRYWAGSVTIPLTIE